MRKFMKFLVRNVPRPILIKFSYVFAALISPFYAGNRYECPVCGGRFRKMMPYGNKGADNRLCPKCLSLERHRLLWIYLRDFTTFFNGNFKVLHIAPEQSLRKQFRKMKNLSYTTADMVSPIAELHFDVMNIPLPDASYDIVFCNHVLEHVENDITAMKQIHRILKLGGWAVMQVPLNPKFDVTFEDNSITSPKERERVFGQYDHVRWHGNDYPERLKSAGFRVEVFNPEQTLGSKLIELYRLDEVEKLYIAYKD